jgi:hypothetical protein
MGALFRPKRSPPIIHVKRKERTEATRGGAEAGAVFGSFLPRLSELVRVSPEREFFDSYTIRGRARLERRTA